MLTCTSVVRASVEGLAGTFIGRSFFWRRGISFWFGQFVSLSMKIIFSLISGRPLLLFHEAKTKTALFLKSNFGFEFGAEGCLFWGVWKNLSWCIESVMLWRGIMGFTKFGDKYVSDLD